MLKKKCGSCGRKIERKFSFCPYCGASFKGQREEEDFGMLGRDDFVERRNVSREMKLPFGLNKIMKNMMKQLEKEMSDLGDEKIVMPRGFKIQISSGRPQFGRVEKKQKMREPEIKQEYVPESEIERRKSLPRIEAESKVRRLGDRIIYELYVRGVKSQKDVVVTKLEEGIEIRAYSKDRCYYKSIPLKVEILGYYLKKDRLFVELRG